MIGEFEGRPWQWWRKFPDVTLLPWWLTIDSETYPFNPRLFHYRYRTILGTEVLEAWSTRCPICEEEGLSYHWPLQACSYCTEGMWYWLELEVKEIKLVERIFDFLEPHPVETCKACEEAWPNWKCYQCGFRTPDWTVKEETCGIAYEYWEKTAMMCAAERIQREEHERTRFLTQLERWIRDDDLSSSSSEFNPWSTL